MEGIVHVWFEAKAFGFLRDASGQDYFCHRRDVQGEQALRQGQRVQFETVAGIPHSRAINVKALD